MSYHEINVHSKGRTELMDITDRLAKLVQESKVHEGLMVLFVPHTTAGVTINEAADPDVVDDIQQSLNKLVPHSGHYQHTEGNADSHIKASIIGSSEVVFIENGRLKLGTWQGVFFCEFDGPRNRRVWVKIL